MSENKPSIAIPLPVNININLHNVPGQTFSKSQDSLKSVFGTQNWLNIYFQKRKNQDWLIEESLKSLTGQRGTGGYLPDILSQFTSLPTPTAPEPHYRMLNSGQATPYKEKGSRGLHL